MDIKFTNRLSYKQARLTVLVGFILGTLLCTLQLDVDTYSFGYRFLRPAESTLLNGFARSLILTGLLVALFYVMLTKPLVRVIRELSGRDSRSIEPTALECPTGHANDEIGV